MRLLTAANRREFAVDHKYPSTYRKQPSAPTPQSVRIWSSLLHEADAERALIRAGFHLERANQLHKMIDW
jgi:hypothetical protein